METTFFSKAMMGAIALCGTVAFTACSSSDNPDVDPIGSESVKTQFSISLPANVAGKTRASVETVQGQTTPVFRGMTGMTLAIGKSTRLNSSHANISYAVFCL